MAELFNPVMSTDEICVGQDDSLCLTDDLTSIKTSIAAKADSTHTHTDYLSEDDAVAAFALANHTHTNYLSEDDAVVAFASASHTHTGYAEATHTHSDLESAIEVLDSGKAESTHTHAQADVTGLVDKLAEIDTAIAALQAGDTEATVTPMLIASMHLGKLDNNSGAEAASSTRICSEPFAVESGKSYWQVNDKAVNMYVLIYDADELFLEYMGNYASGAEIAVTNSNAAYMRLGSTLGEYDLTNEFRIYNVDPNSTGSSEEESFTQDDADLLYAPISHTHSGYAYTDHTHSDYAASTHMHTASDITGLPSSVDAYSKTEADARYALVEHNHSGYAASEHTHAGYAETNHTHSAYAAATHTHTDYITEADALSTFAASGHTHTPASIGAATSTHTHTPASIGAATSSHTHDYLPLSGGTVTGETNFSGGLVRVNGVQTLFHNGSQMILSSNSLPTRICGSSISATQTISIDSDERLKENVAPVDADACMDLINNIHVKTFNYIGDKTPCVGVIAQEVNELSMADRFVVQNEDGFFSVKAADLVFPLIVAVQKLTREVDGLKNCG